MADAMGAMPVYDVNNNDGMGFGGGWVWVIFLFFLMAWGGNGMWGGNNATAQGALTRAELYESQTMQDQSAQLRGITNGLCDGFFAMQNGMNGIGTQVMESRFAAEKCCCETNRNIDQLRFDGSKNTCEITTAIHAEGEATRAMIQANLVQDLRDRLEAKDREILARDNQLSQMSQTQTLVNELRPCAKPAYITYSPYTAAPFNNGYGYGFGFGGSCNCGNGGCC